MQALAIVHTLQEVLYVGQRIVAVAIGVQINFFAFQSSHKALGQCVVVGFPVWLMLIWKPCSRSKLTYSCAQYWTPRSE